MKKTKTYPVLLHFPLGLFSEMFKIKVKLKIYSGTLIKIKQFQPFQYMLEGKKILVGNRNVMENC